MNTGIDAGSPALPGHRRRRLGLAIGLLLGAGIAAAIELGSQSPAPQAAVGNAGTAAGAATVQRRDLIETDTESGTLSYADPQTVYDRLSGTVTWLPAVGQAIRRGQVLFDVDNEPVILLYGSTPAYRQLSSSDSAGPDIGELNGNLIALGYGQYGIIADDSWQTATTDAVEALQSRLGETQTGRFSLGRVVFLPGEQLVNSLDGTVGSPAALNDPSASTEFVDLTKTTTSHGQKRKHRKHHHRKRRAKKSSGAKTGIRSATSDQGSESGSKSSSTGTASSGDSSSGASAGGTAILQTSSTQLIATVELSASSQSEAVVGSRVSVEMPDGTNVNGTITAVSPIAQTPSNDGGSGNSGSSGSAPSATVPVTITLDQRVKGAGLDQAAVSVNFTEVEVKHVMSVPVTALLAVSGGGYAVEQAGAPYHFIPVTTGLFAAGYVEISGPGIYPGLEVTDSQG